MDEKKYPEYTLLIVLAIVLAVIIYTYLIDDCTAQIALFEFGDYVIEIVKDTCR